jgi:hypothetical protein
LRLAPGKACIVDEAQFDKAPDDSSSIRRVLAFPASFAQLPPEIVGQFAGARGKARHISQCHFLEPCGIKWPWRLSFAALATIIRGIAIHPPHSCHSPR